MIATSQHNISRHHWPSICKFRPNDHNNNYWTQHIATLLGATCCLSLATLLWRVETCWVLTIKLVCIPGCNIVAQTWSNDYNIMKNDGMKNLATFKLEPITSNTSQHVATGWPNNVAICCIDMLRSFGQGEEGGKAECICILTWLFINDCLFVGGGRVGLSKCSWTLTWLFLYRWGGRRGWASVGPFIHDCLEGEGRAEQM